MPTKLKTPITLTITHVENAVLAAMYLRGGNAVVPADIHANFNPIDNAAAHGEVFNQLDAALKAQGIDWNTWLPPEPIRIDGREVLFVNDGSILIEGTKVSSETMDEIIQRRAEATGPLYWLMNGHSVYRAKNGRENGEFFSHGTWHPSRSPSMDEYAAENPSKCKRITRAEAAAIIGEENL